MSEERAFPEFLKHMPPARFFALREINWRKEFYLSRFIDELLKSSNTTRVEEWRVKKLWLYNKDLGHIFHDIALIVSRINEDGSRFNRREKIFHISHSRRLTASESGELENLDYVVDYLLLDVRSLLVFIMIFMGKLAIFLGQLITRNGKQMKHYSFHRFRKELMKLKGDEIQKFAQLVTDNTGWFEDVKKWRDKFVIHDPGAGGGIIIRDGRVYATLTRREGGEGEPKYIVMNSRAKDIPADRIDGILYQLKEFLKVLDGYLCSHINILPLEGEQQKTL